MQMKNATLGCLDIYKSNKDTFLKKKTKIEPSVIFSITPKFGGLGKPYITPLPSNGRKHQPTIGPEEDPVRQKLFNQAG